MGILHSNAEEVEAWLDGSKSFSAGDAERFRLGPDAARRTRNYYMYLYGLPMKLRDPGTKLGETAKETEFMGTPAYQIRVSYEEPVGSDVWYFYFDLATYALIGYRFYHDESKNDGEYITLEGEATGARLKLPRARSWYRHQDEGYLGTDTIVSITPLPARQ